MAYIYFTSVFLQWVYVVENTKVQFVVLISVQQKCNRNLLISKN